MGVHDAPETKNSAALSAPQGKHCGDTCHGQSSSHISGNPLGSRNRAGSLGHSSIGSASEVESISVFADSSGWTGRATRVVTVGADAPGNGARVPDGDATAVGTGLIGTKTCVVVPLSAGEDTVMTNDSMCAVAFEVEALVVLGAAAFTMLGDELV